jgi:hypothetical protein
MNTNNLSVFFNSKQTRLMRGKKLERRLSKGNANHPKSMHNFANSNLDTLIFRAKV